MKNGLGGMVAAEGRERVTGIRVNAVPKKARPTPH